MNSGFIKKTVLGFCLCAFLSPISMVGIGAGIPSEISPVERLAGSSSGSPLFSQTKNEESEDSRVIFSQLLIFSKLGRYDRVVPGCKKIIADDCSFLRAYELLVQASSDLSTHSSSSDELNLTRQFLLDLSKKEPDNPYYHYGLGLAYKYGGDYSTCKAHLERCIKLGADFWEVFEELIPYYKSKEELETAMGFLKEIKKKQPENFFLDQGLGYLHFWLDDYDPALKYYRQALKLQRIKGNLKAEAKGLHYLAYLYMYLNDYPRAVECIEQSLRLAREIRDRYQEAMSLELLSFIQLESGDYSEAFKLCSSAHSIAQDLWFKKQQMLCLRTLGIIHMETGDYARALHYLEKSTEFFRRLDESQKLGISLYWMALLHQGMGEFSKALECAQQALKLAQKLGFKTGEAFHLSTIGDIYFSLGNYDKALKFNKQALDITKRYIGKWSREKCFNSIGYVYIEMGQYEKALAYFSQALDYVRKIDHRREEAECLYNIGRALLRAGRDEEASRYFLESLDKAEQSGKKAIKGMNFNRLGDLHLKTGDYAESEKYYSSGLVIGQKIGQPGLVWTAFSGLGKICKQRGELKRAAVFYKEAVKVIEGLRNQISIKEFSSGFFKSKIRIYEQLAGVLYDLHNLYPAEGYDQECFYYAEKAKARAFLDDLQEARVDTEAFLSTKKQQPDVETLSRRISRLLTKLSRNGPSRRERKALWDEMENAEETLQGLIESRKRDHLSHAGLVYSEPLELPAIQNALLDDETGMIEYLVGENNIFIFFCTKTGLTIYRMPPDESRLTLRIITNYMKLLSSEHFTLGDCAIAGRRLYEKLIQPADIDSKKDVKKLIIIPDTDLYYLPFETLIVGDPKNTKGEGYDYLLERYWISYAPSASSLVDIVNKKKKHARQMDLVAVGDPVYGNGNRFILEPVESDDIVQEYYLEKEFSIFPLQYASKELKSISSLLSKDSVRLISQDNATEENLKKLPLVEYKIIHFATHSLLDERVANRSALVLNLDDDTKEDGFFQAREIYNTELDADLVVLSACQTAKGKIEKGEGIQGLARAFFYAGTKSVLGSLWNVDDESTAEFMKYFYMHLAQGKSKQEALGLTKIRMLRSKYDRPYYWASFILIGDSNSRIKLNKASSWERLLAVFK